MVISEMDAAKERALQIDGDGYLERNRVGIGTIADPAFEAMVAIHEFQPIGSVLEIGCSNGFRLDKAQKAFRASCAGLEVSPEAVQEGCTLFREIEIIEGVAPRDLTHWLGRTFDVVVLGHFQYLLPRADVFPLAQLVDQLVTPGGHLICMDFLSPLPSQSPYRHHPDLAVYKHNPSAPWSWSPTYILVQRQVYTVSEVGRDLRDPRTWQTVDVLKKLPEDIAYPAGSPQYSSHDSS